MCLSTKVLSNYACIIGMVHDGANIGIDILYPSPLSEILFISNEDN